MLRIKTLTILSLVIILINCSVLWSEQNPKQTISKAKSGKLATQKSIKQITQSDNAVTTQQFIDAISHAIEATADKAKTTQNIPPPDNSSYWFSCLLTIFTGLLVLVGAGQCYTIFKTLKETQKAADAADASAKALPIMERAYVFSKVIPSRKIEIFHEGFDYDKGLEAILYLKNHGKTPAIIKEIAFYGYKYDSHINDKLVVMNVHAPRESFIGHDEEFEEDRYGFIFITKDEWIGLCTDKPKLYIYCVGYVKYTTIFGDEHCHFFCWELEGPTGKFMLSPNNKLNYDT
jgi:hypothetical protein